MEFDFEYIKNKRYDGVNPTIILIHGLLCDKKTWYQTAKHIPIKFLDNIKKKFSVCIFTIPSSYYLLPIDNLITNIYNLLIVNEVCSPYVVLGHSYGGLISYKFSISYQTDTIGLILIDSSTKTNVFIDRIKADNLKTLSKLEHEINDCILENLKYIPDVDIFPKNIIVQDHFDIKDINLSRINRKHLYNKEKMEKDHIELMKYHTILTSNNPKSKLIIHSIGHFIHHKDYKDIIKYIMTFTKI